MEKATGVKTGLKIALLGAESTGKTTLARELALRFSQLGRKAVAVPEALRDWCVREGRVPRPEEQMAIAQEQERRVDEACAHADIVIADTTAVMVAIYSAMLFDDHALLRFAAERQRSYDITLVTGLDLPWVADGLQRDGPHVRAPVDAQVRELLARRRIPCDLRLGRRARAQCSLSDRCIARTAQRRAPMDLAMRQVLRPRVRTSPLRAVARRLTRLPLQMLHPHCCDTGHQ